MAFSYLLKLYQDEELFTGEFDRNTHILNLCKRGSELGNKDCIQYLSDLEVRDRINIEHIRDQVDYGIDIVRKNGSIVNKTNAAVERIEKKIDYITEYITQDLKHFIDENRIELKSNDNDNEEFKISFSSLSHCRSTLKT